MRKTTVFSTYGARGDVFPYLAIALELKRRGGRPIIATSANYRAEIEALGLEFRAVLPDAPTPQQARQMMHRVSGSERMFRELLLPTLRESVAQLREICADAAVLVTHSLSFAGPIVAELEAPRGLKWASSAVSPLVLFTPEVAIPALPRAADFPALNRAILWLLWRQMGMKLKETQQIRAELGISRGDNALWSDAHSPYLQLALWPEFFAPIAADSPRRALGFCYLETPQTPASALQSWLNGGEAPLVFVAASFAEIENWEKECIGAAQKLRKRAVLLGASQDLVFDSVFSCRFAPLDAILPRAAALIHAGGIGTLALGLRAQIPMLLRPRAHDQFDNARRAEKLGLAKIGRKGDLATQIGALLENRFQQVRVENGAARAAEVLEQFARFD